MKIRVKLFGEFSKYKPEWAEWPTFWYEAQEGTSLQNLLDSIGIPRSSPKTLVHNHRAGKLEADLQDGDIVAVFPPVAGGG